MSAADVDEDQAFSDSQANSQHEFDHCHFHNFRTITVPTTTTTTTQAATTTKTKNCRGLIQKRAHTLDDFMEGKRYIKNQTHKQTNTIFSIKRHVTLSLQQKKKQILIQIIRVLRYHQKKRRSLKQDLAWIYFSANRILPELIDLVFYPKAQLAREKICWLKT